MRGERIAEVVATGGDQITYAPRPDATPEGELDALANVYAYIRRCAAEKKNAVSVTSTDGDEAKGSRNEVRPNGSIP